MIRLEKHKTQTQWETYWRAGYQTGDAPPVIVERHCRSEAEAQSKSEGEAGRVALDLSQHGVLIPVKPFFQKWKVATVTEYDETTWGVEMKLPRPDQEELQSRYERRNEREGRPV